MEQETTQVMPATFHWPVRVYYEDTDCGGIVYHTAYLRFMERARTEWLRSLGLEQTRIRQECGCVFAVRGLAIDYRRPATLDDALIVSSRVALQRRTALAFTQTIQRDGVDQSPLCTAEVRVACLDAERLRPRALPSSLAAEIPDVG